MHSYLKYKEYYDDKARAAPLNEKDYCFVLQHKADHQGSKFPFRDYRWVGPFVVQKVLPNENYKVRRLITNKTKKLHRIRLTKTVPNQPLEDSYREETLQPSEERTNFGDQFETRGNEPIPTNLPNVGQPVTCNDEPMIFDLSNLRICPKDRKTMRMLRKKTLLLKAMQNILQSGDDIIEPTTFQNDDRNEKSEP